MPDPVGSTSWPNRNRAHFERLDQLLLERRSSAPPRILLVGPGAVTRACRSLLRDEARSASALRRAIGDAARRIDQLLRRVPGVPLVSLEALELEQSLTLPHELAVIDVSRRVLAAVARDLPNAQCLQLDLGREPMPMTADVIVAFNVVSRIQNGAAATARLVQALTVGGLLLMDDRSARQFLSADEFDALAPKIHRRRSE